MANETSLIETATEDEPQNRVSVDTGTELEELRTFIVNAGEGLDDWEGVIDFADWQEAFLTSIPRFEIEEEDVESRVAADRSYKNFPLESATDKRTYRLNVHIDTKFGDAAIARLRKSCELMLERVVRGRTNCFIATAKKKGLTWRRKTTLAFPHPLPYSSPPPATKEGRYSEEAAVLAAALHFPLSRKKPGIDLHIVAFEKAKVGNSWTMGSATVNLYNDKRVLRTKLNRLAVEEFKDDDRWAGVIVHEILHNLGWSHPSGSYNLSMAIENYEACIRGVGARQVDPGVLLHY